MTPAPILVVEDDVPLLEMAAQILERAGHTVLRASGPVEATALARATPDLALLFTDVVMPDGSGLDLAAQLSGERPGLPVLITTGQWDGETRRAVLRSQHEALRKPYTSADLCAAVARLLERSDAEGAR